MVMSVVDLTLTKPRARRAYIRHLRRFALGIALVGLLSIGTLLWPASPTDLGVDNRLLTSGLLASWRDGDVVALVRHEERCDRSTNPCLDSIDGLTVIGSQRAEVLGKAFKALGLEGTDMIASPALRTAQTSHFMFGTSMELVPGQLSVCGPHMGEEILSRKQPGRNLVLVTHRGCIADFEGALGYPHALSSDFGSVLFVQVLADGKFKAVGQINNQDWAAALKQL